LERQVLDLKVKKEVSSCTCWVGQKISDSGFTEKSNQKSSEDDELYSLLSLIQFKVESLSYRKEPKKELGTLDEPLGNLNFDFKKFKFNDKNIIQLILNCNDKVELKRQLLFTFARLNVSFFKAYLIGLS